MVGCWHPIFGRADSMAAEQVQFDYFQYTDNDGHHWTVRCDQDWGNNTDSGLAAAVDGDPKLQFVSKRFHGRYAILQDTSGGLARLPRRNFRGKKSLAASRRQPRRRSPRGRN